MKNNKLIGQGRTAEIYSYGDDKIIKLFKAGIGRDTVSLEYEVSKVIKKYGVPSPAIFDLIEVEDRLGIIYEYVNGDSMLNFILKKPWTIIQEGKRLAELHFQIHSFTSKKLPSQRQELMGDIRAAGLLSDDQKDSIITYLEGLDDGEIICHGDFHPDNVLITAKGPIILDWLTCKRGNPVADLARTSLLLQKGAPPPGTSGFMKGIIKFIRHLFHYSYLKQYMSLADISEEELERWKLPVAAARLSENLPETEKLALLKIIKNSRRD